MVVGSNPAAVTPTGSFDQNAIIFGANISSSTHAANRANNISVSGKTLYKELTVQQFMQKKCVQSILVQLEEDFA